MTASTERTGPLAGWNARFEAASAQPEAFAIREVPFACQLNLRGNPADPAFAAPVASALGCALPLAANTVTGTMNAGNSCAALWLGPDEWLIVAPEGRNDALHALLHGALKGAHHSLVDLSANRTIIEISGEHARLVLAKGCPLDLHATRFTVPQCAQTVLAKAQVILQCTDARPVFRLFVRNSYAAYLAEWLADAAAELAASGHMDTPRNIKRLA